jgi:hypothetical protein
MREHKQPLSCSLPKTTQSSRWTMPHTVCGGRRHCDHGANSGGSHRAPQRHRVDAAVVDFVLADANSRTLQALLTEKRLPFVVISGYPSVLVRERKDQQVLDKPVIADNLCTALRAVCVPARSAIH